MIYKTKTTLKILNFADDTLFYTTFKKDIYKTDTAYLNSELDNISKWLKDNMLKLNTDKTRCMLFHSRQDVKMYPWCATR